MCDKSTVFAANVGRTMFSLTEYMAGKSTFHLNVLDTYMNSHCTSNIFSKFRKKSGRICKGSFTKYVIYLKSGGVFQSIIHLVKCNGKSIMHEGGGGGCLKFLENVSCIL